jgi:hypothetical protein
MDVASLIAALVPLLDDPVLNGDAALSLLSTHRTLAEYEVARFVASRRTALFVRQLLDSADPRDRRTAVRWVELTFARAPAARVLRDATKDRSKLVRQAAMRATRALRLDDVALPDTSLSGGPGTRDRQGINPFTGLAMVIKGRPPSPPRIKRGWDPTGWRFGLYRDFAIERRPTPALSALTTREDVARLVGVTLADLDAMTRPGAGPGSPYVRFEVPKSNGAMRVLHAPRPALKRAQRVVLRELLAGLEPHSAAHGFVPGRSTVTNAEAHAGARLLVKMDLVDFFPTIHYGRLIGLFRHYGAGAEAARTLAALVTYRPVLADGRPAWPSVLPQGAPTSPALSNLVCRRMDARLTALSATVGASYTRYTDDLTFSFRDEPAKGLGRFVWWVSQIAGHEGFVENLAKRRILRPGGRMAVTGIVTNAGLSVPRDARRRFRAVLHDCEQRGVSVETTGHEEPRAYLLGFAAYVAMVQPEAGAKLRAEVKRVLAKG